MDKAKQQHITKKSNKETKAMKWYNKKQNTQYERATYEFSPYDGILTSGNTQYLCEVKLREKYSNERMESLGGSILEFKKLSGILLEKDRANDNRSILYFVYLKDCINVYKLSIDPTSYTWQAKWLPNNDYDKEMVWKMVTNLPKEQIIKTIKYK